MGEHAAHDDSTSTPSERLARAIDHASHLLPAQGPITVFIHHNTLHAFQHLPFEEAVERAAEVYGCEPYLPKERYREALLQGRIRAEDLRAVLGEELGPRAAEPVPPRGTLFDLRLAMLQYPIRRGGEAELRWFVEETDALRRVRPEVSEAARARLIGEARRWVMREVRGSGGAPAWLERVANRYGEPAIDLWTPDVWEACALEALWHLCLQGVRLAPQSAVPPPTPLRHRDLLLAVTGEDADLPVNDLLTRFTAAFLDQGVAQWPLPGRGRGLFRAFAALYGRPPGAPHRWLRGLEAELARLANANTPPLESARESLEALGVPEAEWGDYLSATLLALRGWAGMVRETEIRSDSVAVPIPKGSLHEFAAVRLLLDRVAAGNVAREALGYSGPLSGLRDFLRARLPAWVPPRPAERAFPLFQVAQVMGWTPDELGRLSAAEWEVLVREVESFGTVARRRTFHLAYEARFRARALDALALHRRRGPRKVRFQLVACLDDREESFRRHLEEVAPDCETFGAAGFFAMAMYYKGATDAHFVPLCPIVVRPRHWVEEQPDEDRGAHARLRRVQRALGAAAYRAHVGTRSLAAGALLSGFLGVLASVPLVARTLFPRLTARIRNRFGRIVSTPPRTRLALERAPACEPAPRPGHFGYTVEEMAAGAERLLRDIGLTGGFARLVFTVGHGSFSQNNPHKSAYHCGACGGASGAPNGRAAAQVLNDPRVRAVLAGRGIRIPDETVFVGGFHNTCDDSVALSDLDRVPEGHRVELERARAEIEEALDRNAHERCRRFRSAPLDISPREARRHVEGRGADLAQVRPELGHATNAIAHVGRRARTRGLFFDRRMFLTSYDPTQDDADGTILARTMAAVFPVCGGINLEYYFSHVDSPGYGCGTKLPHNIASLLGVMDGAASDLRTGLPWQMVEIHEPVRLLVVVETTPEVMKKVIDGNPLGKEMADGGWVQLAVQSPDSDEILLYHKGEFRPYRPQAEKLPAAPSSAEWYRGCRDHLEFAEIGAG
jgi:uncharacterized protein YbcC (UPF0753/DUF2309 family)